METLVSRESASLNTEPELHLLLERDRADDWRRWRTAAIVSFIAHVLLIATLLLMPESATTLRVYESQPIRLVTPLYIPTELTQKDSEQREAQQGAIGRSGHAPACVEIAFPARAHPAKDTVRCATAADRKIRAETGDRRAAKNRNSRHTATGTDRKAGIACSATAASGPAAETATGECHHASDRPRRKAIRRRASRCRIIRSMPRSATSPGVPCRPRNRWKMSARSAAQTALAPIFRRPPAGSSRAWNWPAIPWALIFGRICARSCRPSSATGWRSIRKRRGRERAARSCCCSAIVKDGTVAKVSFSTESGAKALDQAAVAAISASNPLLPLPKEFKGNQIVLRMTFKYNMQTVTRSARTRAYHPSESVILYKGLCPPPDLRVPSSSTSHPPLRCLVQFRQRQKR